MSEELHGAMLLLEKLRNGGQIDELECCDAIEKLRATHLSEWQTVVEHCLMCRTDGPGLVRLWSLYTLSAGNWAIPEYIEVSLAWLRDKANPFHAAAACAIMLLSNRFDARAAGPDLIRIARDRQDGAYVRLAAYDAILSIVKPPGAKRLPPELDIEENPDRDIDWTLVDTIETSLSRND